MRAEDKQWRAVLGGLLLASMNAMAESQPKLELCVARGVKAEQLTSLRAMLSSFEVLASCTQSASAYLARFVARGEKTSLVVLAPDHAEVERAVPWLDSADDPLTQLIEKRRMSEFSVLLEGLVTELSLDLRSKPADGVSAVSVEPSHTAETRPASPRPARTPASNRVTKSGNGPTVTAGAPAFGWGPSRPTPPLAQLPPPSIDAEAVSAEASTPPAAAAGRGLEVHAEAGLSPRYKTPGVWTLDVTASAGVGPLRVGFSWAPQARLSFGGRPIALDSLTLSIAFRPTVWRHGGWSFDPSLAAVTERIALRRLDIDPAALHPWWDVGVRVGAHLTRSFSAFTLTLQTEGTWSPTSRDVSITDGPTLKLNALCVAGAVLAGARW